MSKKTYRPMRALILAGVLSLAAASAAQATDGPGSPGDNNGRSAALVTGDSHPVLADDGPPGTAGDRNG